MAQTLARESPLSQENTAPIERRALKRRPRYLAATATAVVVCLVVCFPIYWMLVLATQNTIYLYPIHIVPQSISLAAFGSLFSDFPFLRWLINTSAVACGSTLVVLALGIPAAYGMSRFKMRGRAALELFVLVSQMLPVSLLIIPYYLTWKRLGLLDTLQGLLIANMSITLPIAVWMLRGFIDAVDTDVEEAARVDGCTRLTAIWHVLLPMALPGVISTAAFCFVEAWTEYLFAVTLVSKSDQMIVSGGLARDMFEQAGIRWNLLMAGALLATIPAVALILPLQRRLVQGLTAGAVKG